MRKITFLTVTAVLLFAGRIGAVLTVQEHIDGEKVTLDTNTNYYWYWNLHDFVMMDYEDQIDKIEDLGTYGNIAGGWHLASRPDMDTLWAQYSSCQLTDAFGGTSEEGSPQEYAAGRYEEIAIDAELNPSHHYATIHANQTEMTLLGLYFTWDLIGHHAMGAWVCTHHQLVTTHDVVPIPGALALAAIGLLPTLGFMRLRRRHPE